MNYLISALRHIKKYKTNSFLNIAGLYVGMARFGIKLPV
jgi:hypothetical protein